MPPAEVPRSPIPAPDVVSPDHEGGGGELLRCATQRLAGPPPAEPTPLLASSPPAGRARGRNRARGSAQGSNRPLT
eukprot:5538727-Alexandrium_andersonii.AAC.1